MEIAIEPTMVQCTPSKRTLASQCNTPTTSTPNPKTPKRIADLEHENKLLRSALRRMKHLVEYCQEGNRTSTALLEGAYMYCKQKKQSVTMTTPQRRTFHSFPLTVSVTGFTRLDDHIEYEVQVRFGDSTAAGHQTTRRFSEFYSLRQRVLGLAKQQQHAADQHSSSRWERNDDTVLHLLSTCAFPARTMFDCSRNHNVLHERVVGLQAFITKAVEAGRRAGRGSRIRAAISEWLDIASQDEDLVWCDERIRPLMEHDLRTKATRNSEAFQNLLDEQTPVRNVTFLMDDEEEED